VVKNAVCDVLVVQTSALDEERIFRAAPAVPADPAGTGGGGDPAADSGGRSS
jgi:hypothetical protein